MGTCAIFYTMIYLTYGKIEESTQKDPKTILNRILLGFGLMVITRYVKNHF